MIYKALVFVLLLFFLPTQFALSAPASPDLIEIEQPDGSRFTARIHGDEFQNWVEAEGSGHTVVLNMRNKHWEYAEKLPDGTLRASGIKVSGDKNNVPPYILKGLRPDRDIEREKQHGKMMEMVSTQRSTSTSLNPPDTNTGVPSDIFNAPGDWTPAPISGSRKVLIILINFSNRSLLTTAANWNSTIFNTAPGAKSVANFYKDNSFGMLTTVPAAHTQPGNPAGIMTVTIPDAHPNSGGNFNYSIETTILSHALAQAASYIDFNSFDTNGNGTLEQSELMIYFVYAGYEASGASNTPNIWAHAWGGSIAAGNKTVRNWALNGELNSASAQHPMGVIAHELGHALCGLPDLYDTTYTNAGMGNFSLMAGGSWGRDIGEYSGTTPVALDAWSREYLGWTTPVVPAGNGPVSLGSSLASANNVVKLINSTGSSSEYWLAENRYPSGWDLGLRGLFGNSGWSGGMLVSHVDVTSGTQGYNDINKYVAGGHQGVVPEQANTLLCNMLTSGCRGTATALFYNGNNNSFSLFTNPNSNYYSGGISNFALENISAPGATMTADYSNSVINGYTGDGKTDLLWRNPVTGQNIIWFMDGVTKLAPAVALTTVAAPWEIGAVIDFDLDGKTDLLWRNPATGQNILWFMNGAQRIGAGVNLPAVVAPWKVVSVSDFDGDGKPDILWRNPVTGQNLLWFMDGSTKLGPAAALTTVAAPWEIAAVNDFDGDGKADILWRNPATGQNVLWIMNGAAQVGSGINLPSVVAPWKVVSVSDFDGDGKLDILWRNSNSGQNLLWFMDGSTKLGPAAALTTVAAPWEIVAVNDFDRDGKADILWRNPATGQNVLWFMNGAARVGSGVNLPAVVDPWQIAGLMQ